MSQPSMDPKPATVTGELRWWFIDEQYRTLVIAGHIYGDTKKRFADGNYIHTSDVLSGDKETRIIVTKNSSYALGSAADSSYEAELWARLDLKPATPPAADVVAQIRERAAWLKKFAHASDRSQAMDDVDTLLSLLAARDARVAALESALRDADGWFREYAYGHEAKGSTEKAATNHRRADACRALITGSTPERRVADEPWRIPARVGKVVLQADIGVIVEIDALRVPLHFGEYRRLMGRRKSDWSET